jgi:hypothetical protein
MHKHKAKAKETTTTGWTHCVAAGDCDGSAHGGVTYREVCACGAVRYIESNGAHRETSAWDDPDDSGSLRVRGTVLLTLAVALATGCAAPMVRAPTIIHAAPVTVATGPVNAPASAPASTLDAVVAALVTAARTATVLPEQVEVTVGSARYACFRWPLEELLAGKINADTLWSVYVRELRTDGRKLDFEVR